MALRLKKDIKKASYYVWFLGAQESRGLRGEEYAVPAIRILEARASELEPFKVTLQVSHKGLKIIQNVTAKGKQQTIKHFIPHGSITSAVVQSDVVACVLLLYNPLTGCPVHVHAYRCDSDHTAEMLYTHLQALIERPENQKKFADIEKKLQLRGALPVSKKPPDSSLGSEVSRESDSGSNEERCVANLYDSLAAELKQKLSTGKKGLGKSPILLPPRDYDTVHRQKGNLSNIDTRRCLNQSIVGVNARRKLESSGGSSGIGSDLAPSPERNEYTRQHDAHSTSEEDWAESTAYMMHDAFEVAPSRRSASPPPRRGSLSRRTSPRRGPSPRRASPPRRAASPPRRVASPPRRVSSPPRRVASPPRRVSPPRRAASPPRRAISPYREPYSDDFPDREFRDQLAPFREQAFARYRHESLERAAKEKSDKYTDGYRRRFVAEPKPSSRVLDRPEERRFGKLVRGVSEGSLMAEVVSPKDRFVTAKEKFMNLERERFTRELEQHMAKRRSMLEINGRSTSSPEEESRDERQDRHRDHSSRREPERSLREPERSLREPERSLREPERSLREPERSLREPERSLREPERLLRDPERSLREPERLLREPERSLREPERSLREPERSHREPERSLRDIERSHRELERRKDDRILEREDSRELVHREIERLPRVGRPKRDEPKRYEYGNGDYMNRNEVKSLREDFDRYRERDRRDLERRVDDDEIIEPVIEERRRDWSDRQRVFSRARLIDDQRQGYEGSERERDRFFERDYRDFRDLAQRQPPAKFRHSYAEPLPRGRLAPVRPY